MAAGNYSRRDLIRIQCGMRGLILPGILSAVGRRVGAPIAAAGGCS